MPAYIVSGTLNYNLLIAEDAGPAFALNMGWTTIYLNKISPQIKEDYLIVDPRLQEVEIDTIENLIIKNPAAFFFLRVADPYPENGLNHFYYKFLAVASKYQHCFLFSTYTPKAVVLELKKLFGNRFIHLPYPYLIQKELPLLNTHKKNKIIITGSLSQLIYPYRYAVWQKVTRSLSRFIFFSILRHPGYADLNATKTHAHTLIGREFIKHLSKYKYMLLCPSRFGIELLKYNECAYAGCIPVGEAPDCYPKEIRELFLPLRPENLFIDTLRVTFKYHDKNNVPMLRKFLSETRNPAILNNDLKKFIADNPIRVS